MTYETIDPEKERQDRLERYARETRGAVVFIAWCVGIVVIISLVGAIIAGIDLAKVNSDLNNGGGSTTSSNCVSQGGTNPGC
jgi:hypothetical protein